MRLLGAVIVLTGWAAFSQGHAQDITGNDLPSPTFSSSWNLKRFLRKHTLHLGASHDRPDLPPDEWFEQNLDHFHPTDTRTWKQRFFTNDKYYKPGGPAFLMIGGEGEASPVWMEEGAWIEYAKEYGAVCFQLEHRFYGKSHPTEDMSVKNLAYLTSEQALADLANFVTSMSEQRNLTDTKWIAFGGSYPGTLAAWFRLKYPHLVHGSVSTSGPVLAKADFFEYLQVVSDSLDYFDKDCRPALQKALERVDLLTRHRVGWSMITKIFDLCTPFDGTKKHDVANFFENLVGNFEDTVQYNKDNRAFEGARNTNVTVNTLCDIMTGKKSYPQLPLTTEFEEDLDSLEPWMVYHLRQGDHKTVIQRLAAVNKFVLSLNDEKCMDHSYDAMINQLKETAWDTEAGVGGRQWLYQTCTEFGWYQSSDQPGHPYTTYFPIKFLEKQCMDIYGPRYNIDLLNHGIRRTNILYGAKDLKVSNVVFVHGSIDPWHAMGITKDLGPDATAIYITGTAHCANMYPESPDDVPQLKAARVKIGKLIGKWLRS